MDLAGYVALTRVSGLAKELQSVANNIANLSTTGYRREGVVFAEMVQALSAEGGSVAMTEARGRYTDELQGALVETGGTLDLAVEGDGYFTVMTAEGERLTRAGAFTRNADGTVVNMDGHPLLDEGGGEIVIPFEAKNDRRLGRRHDLGRRPAGGEARPGAGRGPDQAVPRGRRAVPRRHRGRVRRERQHRPGLPRAVERQPGRRARPDGRGAARLRVRARSCSTRRTSASAASSPLSASRPEATVPTE